MGWGQEVEAGVVLAGMLEETVGHGPSVIWPSSVWADETTALTAETTPPPAGSPPHPRQTEISTSKIERERSISRT